MVNDSFKPLYNAGRILISLKSWKVLEIRVLFIGQEIAYFHCEKKTPLCKDLLEINVIIGKTVKQMFLIKAGRDIIRPSKK